MFCLIETNKLYLILVVLDKYRPGQPNWEFAMWKFQDFSATKILGDINSNSNRRILFVEFPEFDPNHGSSGDTLVWDAFLNRLFIQHQDDQYKAMCYRVFGRSRSNLK